MGMRPLCYSDRKALNEGIGWYRDGDNISYYLSNRKKVDKDGRETTYYALSFDITMAYDNDTVYFAQCYPYTYSDLRHYVLNNVTNNTKDRIRRTSLCKSNAGNEVDLLIVTNFESEPVQMSVRPAVILTARVHPSETQASWMM